MTLLPFVIGSSDVLHHITAINPDSGHITARSFFPSQEEELKAFVSKQNKQGYNVYVNYNPPMYEMRKKCAREDIRDMRVIHVDLDPAAGQSYEDLLAAFQTRYAEWLAQGNPPYTALIKSGNGVQVIWALAEPVNIGGDKDVYEDLKMYNVFVEQFFGGDSCHNLDRVLRMPGTVNWPNAQKREAGRKPVQAEIIAFDEVRHPLSAFKKATSMGSGAKKKKSGNKSVEIKKVAIEDPQAELAKYKLDPRVVVVMEFGKDPEKPKEGDNSRSAWLFDFVCNCMRAGVPNDVIYALITDDRVGISESVLDKKDPDAYAKKQIATAEDFVRDPDLAEMNGRYAVIANYGGKCMVAYAEKTAWGVDDNGNPITRQMPTFQKPSEFAGRYANQLIQIGVSKEGKPIMENKFKWWFKHPERKQYDTAAFMPGSTDPDILNLWKGFAVQPVPGDRHQPYLDHIFENVCDGSQSDYDYLLNWMAYNVQKPGTRPGTAVALRGGQGTGKSIVVNIYGHLFGTAYLHIMTNNALTGDFNGHLQNVKVVFADEAIFARDKRQISRMKGLITEAELQINPKGLTAMQIPNYLAVFLASNDDAVINAASDERRYAVYDVSPKQQQNSTYFTGIMSAMRSGGYENLLHFLLHRDLEGFDIRKVPQNEALRNQKLTASDDLQAWWFHKLNIGQVIEGEPWPEVIPCADLRSDCSRSMNQFKQHPYHLNEITFGKFLSGVMRHPTMPNIELQTRVRKVRRDATASDGLPVKVEKAMPCYLLPTLEECRKVYEAANGPQSWEVPLEDHLFGDLVPMDAPF